MRERWSSICHTPMALERFLQVSKAVRRGSTAPSPPNGHALRPGAGYVPAIFRCGRAGHRSYSSAAAPRTLAGRCLLFTGQLTARSDQLGAQLIDGLFQLGDVGARFPSIAMHGSQASTHAAPRKKSAGQNLTAGPAGPIETLATAYHRSGFMCRTTGRACALVAERLWTPTMRCCDDDLRS